MVANNSTHRRKSPDYGPGRRRAVLKLLRDASRVEGWEALEEAAHVMYALSGLMCDDDGAFNLHDVQQAMRDPSAVSYARRLIAEAA